MTTLDGSDDRANGYAKAGLDQITLDLATGRVLCGPDSVGIGVRGARILQALLDKRGKIVPLAELIEAGWPGYSVEDSSLSVEMASLRGALQRLIGGRNWITFVPRTGYRLAVSLAAARAHAPGNWETPTLAVLPLKSGTTGLAPMADALTQTITTTLALHAGLSVAPRHIAALINATPNGGAGDLALRYLLEGVIYSDGTVTRLALTLCDTVEGRIIWTHSVDAPAPMLLDRQDQMAADVVQALDVLLLRGQEAEVGYRPTRNLQAWSYYIRGLGHAYWPRRDMLWGSEILLALGEWHKALALDPDSPDLHATIGAGYSVLAAYPSVFESVESVANAQKHLQLALHHNPDHPIALAFHSLMLTEADRFEVAAEVARRAVRLAPHAPAVTAVAAVALCAAGQAHEAVNAIERALAATPHFPAIYSPPLARAWRSTGRVDEAIRFLEALNDEPHKFDGRELILAYAQAGRHEDAVNVATQLLMLEPGFTVSGWLKTQHRADRAAIARDAAALRAVGLPD